MVFLSLCGALASNHFQSYCKKVNDNVTGELAFNYKLFYEWKQIKAWLRNLHEMKNCHCKWFYYNNNVASLSGAIFNPKKPGGMGIIFAHAKFKLKLFLNRLWYEPQTLWLFPTFTSDCFTGKKNKKLLNF